MTQTLARYRIDRANGLTANGPEKLVIIVLTTNESAAEFVVAVSKLDAMLISLQLASAASEAQAETTPGLQGSPPPDRMLPGS